MEAPRRIEHRYRVRFDEADADGRLRPSGLLRYTQDMASRHSEEAGFDRAWYDERAMHWLVRNISLRIHAPLTFGDVLTISTEVVGLRQVWARRHTTLRHGALLVAVVDTDWVLLRHDGKPSRVPEEITKHFSVDQTFTRNRVVLPEPTVEPTTLETRVRPIDVDPLRHMNNAAYLDFVDDALARMRGLPGAAADCYQVGYVRPALLGSAIGVACWPVAERTVACRVTDGEDNELTRVLVNRSEP